MIWSVASNLPYAWAHDACGAGGSGAERAGHVFLDAFGPGRHSLVEARRTVVEVGDSARARAEP